MGFCREATCGCSFYSDSLVMSGSGKAGNPLRIETYEGVVAAEGDVASPFLGQRIYETSTERIKIYDGTNWVIIGGNMPRVELVIPLTGTQDVPTSTTTEVDYQTIGDIIVDTDSFFGGSGGLFFIQAGLGGDYFVTASHCFTANAANGTRSVFLAVANNSAVPDELTAVAGTGDGGASANYGPTIGRLFRLAEGAQIIHQAWQNTGVTLDIIRASFTMHMIRHIPSLV